MKKLIYLLILAAVLALTSRLSPHKRIHQKNCKSMFLFCLR